jgi:mannose-6-phosphate isomerase
MSLAPILLLGELHETIWGGHRLATVAGKKLPANALVGESWETSLTSIARNEPYTNKSLGTLTADLGVRLYGTRAQAIFGDRFPLLAKFIDAHSWLSVQNHPDDAYAREHEGGKLGKTEAWLILHADPEAEIIHGMKDTFTRAQVAEAIASVHLEDLTYRMPVSAGDVVINHAGTLHATGAGIVLYEIQEYSDVTYRLYDYGRVGPDGKGRELHIERGLDVLTYEPLKQHLLRATPIIQQEQLRVACTHFALAELTLSANAISSRITDGTSCQIVSIIKGAGSIRWEDDQTLPLTLGDTLVLPADAARYTLVASNEGLEALASWIPIADDPNVAAWKAANGA